jgi:chorismate synthase
MALSEADIQPDLDRRKPGTSRHVTQRREDNRVEISQGVLEALPHDGFAAGRAVD